MDTIVGVRKVNLLADIARGITFGFAITPRSLLVAYCLGMIVTFLTVLFSPCRVSRLNIVAAIRDLPDLKVHRARSRSTVLWTLASLGALALAVGGWLNTNALASGSARRWRSSRRASARSSSPPMSPPC